MNKNPPYLKITLNLLCGYAGIPPANVNLVTGITLGELRKEFEEAELEIIEARCGQLTQEDILSIFNEEESPGYGDILVDALSFATDFIENYS